MDTTEPAAHETAANGYEKTHHGNYAGHEMHAGHTMPDRDSKHHGHDAHAGHSVGVFRDKFWLSLRLTLPTLVWGHMVQRRCASGATGRECSRRRYGSRRVEPGERVDDHRRVASNLEERRRQGHRRYGERRRLTAGRGHRHR